MNPDVGNRKVGVQPSGCGGTLKRELQHRRRAERNGYVLVLVVAMLFGLFALAALVIDFGFVRLTQRQMLAATDAAAMEGLRWRDVQNWEELPGYLNPSNLTGSIPLAQQPAIGRMAAAKMVLLMMARNGSDEADPVDYGFGPELQYTATTSGGPAAGPLITADGPHVYHAHLQTNDGNATNGDIVSGDFGPDQPAVEQSDYSRNDFSPAASSASGTNPPPSLLVRMRRVAPGNPLDQQSNVALSDPAVPFLFGYGAPIDRASIAQGVTVRGTTIASIGFNPANNPQISSGDPNYGDYRTIGMTSSVGWPYSWSDEKNVIHNQIGAVPIAIYADSAAGNDQWSPLVTGQSAVTLTVASDAMTLKASNGTTTVGFLVNQTPWVVTQGQNSVLSPVVIGQPAAAAATALPDNQSSAYVLLLSAANQVIGFGAVDGLSSGSQSITFKPMQNRVAWENASAMLVQPFQPGVDVQSLWKLRAAVQYPLFSPVLVNR